MHDGSCICGAVQVAVTVELPEAIACHCTACRKLTGRHGAFVEPPRSALKDPEEEHGTFRRDMMPRRMPTLVPDHALWSVRRVSSAANWHHRMTCTRAPSHASPDFLL